MAAAILLVAIIAAIVLTLRQRTGLSLQDISRAGGGAARGPRAHREDGVGDDAIDRPRALPDAGRRSCSRSRVAGIFLNRKNVILLLMCIELMLLAVNFNFIAFSRFLGDLDGQVFVFFILTVAAAESAIGLAILVVLFRNRRSINVEELERSERLGRGSSRSISPSSLAPLIAAARRRALSAAASAAPARTGSRYSASALSFALSLVVLQQIARRRCRALQRQPCTPGWCATASTSRSASSSTGSRR